MQKLESDIVVVGAKSMFMTDYIATGKVVPERIAEIVSGIAMACKEVGVSLIGGETAEHPGLLKPNEYDVAGAAVGAVEYSKLLGPNKVQVGDVVGLRFGETDKYKNQSLWSDSISFTAADTIPPPKPGVVAIALVSEVADPPPPVIEPVRPPDPDPPVNVVHGEAEVKPAE